MLTSPVGNSRKNEFTSEWGMKLHKGGTFETVPERGRQEFVR